MIVVTGAAGQVGTVLVRSLLEKNERVKAIVTPEDDLTSIEASVERLIYTSSVHAFVELPQGQLIDETAPIDPDQVVGDYAKSKAKATLLVRGTIAN